MSNAKHAAGEQGRGKNADRSTSAREKAGGAAQRLAAQVEANPLLLVAGGVALGAVAGALLPRSEQERSLLAPVGQRIGGAVTAAIEAGREAGQGQLDELGLNREAARNQVKTLFDGLVQAASTAGSAAAQAAAEGAQQRG